MHFGGVFGWGMTTGFPFGRLLRQAQGRLLRQAQGRLLRQAQGRLLRQAQGRLLRQAQGRLLRQAQGRLLRQAQGRLSADAGMMRGAQRVVFLRRDGAGRGKTGCRFPPAWQG